MTDAQYATLGTLFTALVTLIVSIINARQAQRISKKTDEVHDLVNGNMSIVKSDLSVALERVGKLEELLSEFIGSKRKVDQAVVNLPKVFKEEPA